MRFDSEKLHNFSCSFGFGQALPGVTLRRGGFFVSDRKFKELRMQNEKGSRKVA